MDLVYIVMIVSALIIAFLLIKNRALSAELLELYERDIIEMLKELKTASSEEEIEAIISKYRFDPRKEDCNRCEDLVNCQNRLMVREMQEIIEKINKKRRF